MLTDKQLDALYSGISHLPLDVVVMCTAGQTLGVYQIIGDSITVVGDSMGREVFYGVAGTLSSRAQDYHDKKDIHWKISKGQYASVAQPVHVDLYRSNFAMAAAHSFDGVYHKRVIENEYDDKHPIRRASGLAIQAVCDAVDDDDKETWQFWMPCPLSNAPTESSMYIANAAAWEHRALWGIYGFDWDLV